MNASDIEYAANRPHECPNVRKGLLLLSKLAQSVNEQSDGWHSWPPPRKSAEKLIALLNTAGNLPYGTHGTITAADLRKAVAPIKAMVTRQREKQKKYGNTFDFDVEAALKN